MSYLKLTSWLQCIKDSIWLMLSLIHIHLNVQWSRSKTCANYALFVLILCYNILNIIQTYSSMPVCGSPQWLLIKSMIDWQMRGLLIFCGVRRVSYSGDWVICWEVLFTFTIYLIFLSQRHRNYCSACIAT